MKKYRLFLIVTIIILLTTIIIVVNKNSYKNVINNTFGIDISNTKIDKILDKDEWGPNGDGERLIVLKYNNLKKIDLKKLNKLPTIVNLPPNTMPKEYLQTKVGYYKCIIDKNDNRNFEILIINTQKKEIYIFYQIM